MASGYQTRTRSVACRLLLAVLTLQVVTPDSTDFSPTVLAGLLKHPSHVGSLGKSGLLRGKRALHIGGSHHLLGMPAPLRDTNEDEPIDEVCILSRTGLTHAGSSHLGNASRHRLDSLARTQLHTPSASPLDLRRRASHESDLRQGLLHALCRLIC